VTISTNMAGRGVDIILGGDPPDLKEQMDVKNAGGLHVVGTERHESRRIDNQLRGRSGRQGDSGSSRFFVSLQDDLMRIFGGASVERLMDRFGLDDSVPLEAGLVSKAIENAQKKVEGFNFDRRKQLVEMDDVMNVHREVVYKLRKRILELGEGDLENKDWFLENLKSKTDLDAKVWDKNVKEFGEKDWLQIMKDLSLPVIDYLWMEHLVDMDQVREGIGLQGYAQRDPMVEYKREGHERFEILVARIYSGISERISHVSKAVSEKDNPLIKLLKNAVYQRGEIETGVSEEARLAQRQQSGMSRNLEPVVVDSVGRKIKVEEIKSNQPKVGRNDPCPCGSGKKFKHCHGR
jgi:preprotein translocase subunit SecA